MEDVESERRISRRKRKLSTRQGVVIGVATVAGLGLMTKLLSFMRREKPKKVEDGDIETLEAVLSGDAAKSALPRQTAEVHVFANLENDEPSHEGLNGHEVSPPSSEDADSKATKKDDITEEGEKHVSQDLVGDRDVTETNTLTTEESEVSPVSQEEVNVKEMPHSNGDDVEGKHQYDAVEVHNEDEGKVNGEAAVTELHVEDKEKPHIEDAEQLPSADVVELHSGDEVKPRIEDAVEVHTEDEAKQPNGDALEVLVQDVEKLPSEDAVELPIKGENHHNEDVAELRNEKEAKTHTEEAENPHSEAAVEPLIEDGEKLETKDEGKQSSEDLVELPIKDEEKHQTVNGGELQTEDEEAAKLQS